MTEDMQEAIQDLELEAAELEQVDDLPDDTNLTFHDERSFP